MASHNASTTLVPDVDVPKANKRFIPLENNPQVMTTLLHRLGLSPHLSWSDIYSLTDPDLLSFLPRPSYALLLVFPVSPTYESHRQREDASVSEYTAHGPSEEVLWFKQTIGNACGLYGLLHSVGNGAAREQVLPNSELDRILTQAVDLDPVQRSRVIYESTALEEAHREAAREGDSVVPDAADEVELHFVAFVVVHSKNGGEGGGGGGGRLWEMDGRRKGPILRGEVPESEDVLGSKALEMGPLAFLKREEEAGCGELRFSALSLGPGFD